MALGRDIIWILTLKCDEAMRLERNPAYHG